MDNYLRAWPQQGGPGGSGNGWLFWNGQLWFWDGDRWVPVRPGPGGEGVFIGPQPPPFARRGALWWNGCGLFVWTGDAWVETNCCDQAGSVVSECPPDNPRHGQLWFSACDRELYVWAGAWVAASCCPIPVTVSLDPPSDPEPGQLWITPDGKIFVWNGTTWLVAGGTIATVSPTAPTSPNPGDLWITPAGPIAVWSGTGWQSIALNLTVFTATTNGLVPAPVGLGMLTVNPQTLIAATAAVPANLFPFYALDADANWRPTTGGFQFASSGTLNVEPTTSMVLVQAATSSIIINLPPIASVPDGWIVRIAIQAASATTTVTVAADASDTAGIQAEGVDVNPVVVTSPRLLQLAAPADGFAWSLVNFGPPTNQFPGWVPAQTGAAGTYLDVTGGWSVPGGGPSPGPLPDIANNTVLGNVSGATAQPAALNAQQIAGILGNFTSALSGLVPPPGGATPVTYVLQANGTWVSAASLVSGNVAVATNATLTGNGTTASPLGTAQAANDTLMGNVSGAAAAPVPLTAAQVTTLLGLPLPSTMPTVQRFLSGSGTYTPTSPTVAWIRVRMCGGGGGGAGGGAPAATAGGTTTFGGWSANGGGPGNGAASSAGGGGGLRGTGGTNGAGTLVVRLDGGPGLRGMSNTTAAVASTASPGGFNPFGGGSGSSGGANGTPQDAAANTGAGGYGGFALGNTIGSSGGGGAGEYVECLIAAPSAMAYAVAAGGTAGAAGVSVGNGGPGSAGIIIVEEMY